MGVNICACLNSYFRIQSNVKWPNDIHIDGKKVAGILTEARMDSDHTRELILGVGLNINSSTADWPAELQSIATSIRQITGEKADLNQFTAILAGRVYQAYDQFIADSYRSEMKEMWSDYDLLINRKSASCMERHAFPESLAESIFMGPWSSRGKMDPKFKFEQARSPSKSECHPIHERLMLIRAYLNRSSNRVYAHE